MSGQRPILVGGAERAPGPRRRRARGGASPVERLRRCGEPRRRITPSCDRHPGPSPVGAHRDWLQALHGLDTDAWIHPPLIRFLAGYLDQGLAHWEMPGRHRGIHGCFLEIYSSTLAARCGHWARTLPALVAADRAAGWRAASSIENSLAELGVADDEYESYLSAELLALRGWAASCARSKSGPTACRRGT